MAGIGPFIKEFVINLVSEPVDPPFTPVDPCRGLIVKQEVQNLLFDGAPPGGDIDTLGIHSPEA